MLTEKLQQTIQEEVEKLPKEAQDAINALDWMKLAEEIGKEFSLEESEMEDFQLETLLVLIGATDPEFYAVNIENHVETTKDQAESLAKEGFQKIFTPIRNTLTENIKKNLKNKMFRYFCNLAHNITTTFSLYAGNICVCKIYFITLIVLVSPEAETVMWLFASTIIM